MAIAFVLHEATRTGAPRLGALIARELARDERTRVIVMKDGPLTPWLRETLGPQTLVVCRGDPFAFRAPFEERLRLAGEMLEGEACDLVYANSLAASVFALAGALQKRKTLVHVHEKKADMVNLLAHDVAKLEVMRVADAAVLAADDIRDDLAEVFRFAPPEIESFGVAVDVEAIRAAAREAAPPPLNAQGRALARGERLVVGMSGHASARKGADIFLSLAGVLPECDFLWVGGWRPDETPDNVAYDDFLRRPPPNLYLAGAVDNPYPYMRMMDLFFLASREDPNPLVLAEALALGVPILGFSKTSAIADRLGRAALLCYGRPNVADAARVLRAASPESLRRPGFRSAGEAFVADCDVRAKMPRLRQLIARLRGVAAPAEPAPVETPPADLPPPDADAAIRRDLGQGVVELSFS